MSREEGQLGSLVLRGFKSFADRATLEILGGLTGIVGPNGCGKTNIVESFRWLTGVQSARVLRGGTMEDIIFMGAENRLPSSSAEVIMSLRSGTDNYIEIAREYSRKTGSRFWIDGKETTNREIQIVFADMGLGEKSLGMTSQGEISALVKADEEKRKEFLEIIAGVRGMLERKKESERKLRGSEENLASVRHNEGIIGVRLEELRGQKLKLEKYRHLDRELKQRERLVVYLRYKKCYQEQDTLLVRIESLGRQKKQQERELVRLERDCSSEETRLSSLQRDISKYQTSIQDLQYKLSSRELEELNSKKYIADKEVQLRALDEEYTKELEGKEGRGEKYRQTEKDIEGYNVRSLELRGKLESISEEYNKEREGLASSGGELALLKEDYYRQRGESGSLEKERVRLHRQRDKNREQQDLSKLEIARLKESTRLAQDDTDGVTGGRKKKIETALAVKRSHLLEVVEKKKRLEEEERELKSVMGRESVIAGDNLRESSVKLRGLLVERETLSRIIGKERLDESSFISYLVLEEGDAHAGYDHALGGGLGEKLLASIGEYGTERQRYWREVLLENKRRGEFAGTIKSLDNYVVRCSSELVRQVLSFIGLVGSEEEGDSNQGSLKDGHILVSLEGIVWHADGYKNRQGGERYYGLLQEIRRVASLDEEIEALKKEEEGLAQTLKRIEEELGIKVASSVKGRELLEMEEEGYRGEVELLERQLQEIESRALLRKEEEAHDEGRLGELEKALVRSKEEGIEIEEALITLDKDLQQYRNLETEGKELEEKERELKEGESVVRGLQGDKEFAEREYNETLSQEKAARQLLSHQREVIEGSDERLERLEGRCEELRTELAGLRESLEGGKIVRGIIELRGRLEGEREELARLEKDKDISWQSLEEHKNRYIKCRDGLAVTDKDYDRAIYQNEHNSASLETALLKLQETKRRQGLSEVAWEEEMRGVEVGGQDIIRLSAEIEKLRLEQEGLGDINFLAERNYRELELESEELSRQCLDLEGGIRGLRDGIKRLEARSDKKFRHFFTEVASNFDKCIKSLFIGGEGYLELVERGVEMRVKIRGKRAQSMSLLSGGEQTLVSLALLLSAFIVNPAPLCVMDEVDAALDENNTERFCKLLSHTERVSGTAFLVITHNRITMTHLHRLYGVVMAERGISRIVSVSLEEGQTYAEV